MRNLEFDRTPSQDLECEYGNAYSFQQKITALRQPGSKDNNKWQLKTSTWPHHDTVNFFYWEWLFSASLVPSTH